MKSLTFVIACCILFLQSLQLFSQEGPDNRSVWKGGQKGYVITGDISILKGQKTFNVVVTPNIEKMGVKEEPDSVYVSKRVKEFNDKEAGKGDQWLNEWNATKMNFKAAFIEGFNSKLKNKGVNVGLSDTTAEYTLIIYTKSLLEFWGEIFIILDMQIVKTQAPNSVIVKIRFPLNNSKMASKQFKGKNERAYYAAGVLFSRYCDKNVF